MSSKNKNNFSFNSFFSGFLIGSIVGGVLAILFAPKAGSEIRDTISDGMSSAQAKTRLLLDTKKEDLTGSLEQTSKNLEGTVKRITNAFNAGRKAATEKETIETSLDNELDDDNKELNNDLNS